jgi:hypothetical protein
VSGIVGVFKELPYEIGVPSGIWVGGPPTLWSVITPHYYAHPEGEQWNPDSYLSMRSLT